MSWQEERRGTDSPPPFQGSYPTRAKSTTGKPRQKPTQLERVIRALRRGWVCAADLNSGEFDGRAPIWRYGARIYEAREAGWWVEKRRCEHPWHHHKARVEQWRIVARPPEDGQLFGDPT